MQIDRMRSLLAWSWDDSDERAFAEWTRVYHGFLHDRLGRVLDSDAGLAKAYQSFPREAEYRLLREPLLLNQLTARDFQLSTARETMIHVLSAALDRPEPLAVDRHALGGSAGGPALRVAREALFTYPRPGGNEAMPPPRPEHRDAVGAQLEESAAFIASSGARPAAFVAAFVELLFAGDRSGAPACSAGSFEGLPGLPYATNVHLAEQLQMADTLVHEAVHAALFMFECVQHPLLHSHRKAERYQSPWTGAALRLAAYVHACFVWYALAYFWREASRSHPGVNCLAMMGRAVSGFLEAPITGRHRSVLEEHVSPPVLRCLEQIERRIVTDDWSDCRDWMRQRQTVRAAS